MNLEKAIEVLKDNNNVNEILENCGCKVMSSIDVVLNELNRLKEETDILRKELVDISSKSFQEGYQAGFKQAKFDCEMDKLDGR